MFWLGRAALATQVAPSERDYLEAVKGTEMGDKLASLAAFSMFHNIFS